MMTILQTKDFLKSSINSTNYEGECHMKRLFILLAILTFVPNVLAGAIWTNYEMKINHKNVAKVQSLMENYFKTDAGKSFPGLWIYNTVVANGTQEATHNFALVYKDEKQWEERRAAIADNKDSQRMMTQINSLTDLVSETVYEHVGGYGLPAEQTKQWMGVAANVKDEARYLEIVGDIMSRTDPAASIDFWAVRAGGATGVTHVVTIGVQSRADYNSNPEVKRALAEVGQTAKDVRSIVGVNYADAVLIKGPLTSADMR